MFSFINERIRALLHDDQQVVVMHHDSRLKGAECQHNYADKSSGKEPDRGPDHLFPFDVHVGYLGPENVVIVYHGL